MIFKYTKLIPLDKSGVWEVKTFHLYGGFYVKSLKSGGFIKISVRKTKPNNWVSKGSKSKAIIIYNSKELKKIDGSTYKLKYNSLVLLKKRLTPKGKEIFGPSVSNIRRKKFINSFVGVL
jgi:ribosomal protein L14